MQGLRLAALALGLALAPTLTGPANAAMGERWHKVDAHGLLLRADAGPWQCVRDRRTGLTWENKSDNEGVHYEDATYSWRDAAAGLGVAGRGSCRRADGSVHPCDSADLVAAANRERWCGLAGWRLPAAAELESLLFDPGFAGSARIAYGYLPHTGRHVYWSGTMRAGRGGELEAAVVHFGSGATTWLAVRRAACARLVTADRAGPAQPVAPAEPAMDGAHAARAVQVPGAAAGP